MELGSLAPKAIALRTRVHGGRSEIFTFCVLYFCGEAGYVIGGWGSCLILFFDFTFFVLPFYFSSKRGQEVEG